MRSDRNPYFLYKKSRDPLIQQLLKDAETLSISQIEKMSVKPDVKRAMLFVAQLGHQTKSDTTANLLAEKMIEGSTAVAPDSWPIWQYLGEAKFAKCVSNGSVQIQCNDVFIQKQNQLFIQHIWCHIDHDILSQSQSLGMGTFENLNVKIQEILNQRYRLNSFDSTPFMR